MNKCKHASRSLFPRHSSVIFHPDGNILDNMSSMNFNTADNVTMDTGDNNTTVNSPVELTAAELFESAVVFEYSRSEALK